MRLTKRIAKIELAKEVRGEEKGSRRMVEGANGARKDGDSSMVKGQSSTTELRWKREEGLRKGFEDEPS